MLGPEALAAEGQLRDVSHWLLYVTHAHSLALLIFPISWTSATGKGREKLRIFLFPHFAGFWLFSKAVSLWFR